MTKFTDVRKDKTSVQSNKTSVKCPRSYLLEVMASLWGCSIQSSARHWFCVVLKSVLWILSFFFFISINIYLCVWFSPQKCSNICSAVVARNRYLLSTMPSPCKAPTGTQPASQLVTRLPVFKPSSRSQRSYFTQHKELLKARAGVITEIEKMWIISIFSYFSFFPHPLQTSSNQFTC